MEDIIMSGIFSDTLSSIGGALSNMWSGGVSGIASAVSGISNIGVNGRSLENASRVKAGTSPYKNVYGETTGYVFGRPIPFNAKADPNQRVFQRTMLRNSTVVTIIPGKPYTDFSMVEKAKGIMETHVSQVKAAGGNNDRLAEITMNTQRELLKGNCDLRFLGFKKDVAGFTNSYQMLLNRVGTAIFGINGLTVGPSINESSATGGFKLWCEKGTSVSE